MRKNIPRITIGPILNVTPTIPSGLQVIIPRRHHDERGHFTECYNDATFRLNGVADVFVQDNHVYSAQAGTLRGLHFQKPPHAQAKLIRCTAGRILDVALDIRRGSETYGEYFAIELSAEQGNQLYVPVGFAHGYCTLTSNCDVQYKVSDYYKPSLEDGINPTDQALAVNWRIEDVILSSKDKELPLLSDLDSPFYNDR